MKQPIAAAKQVATKRSRIHARICQNGWIHKNNVRHRQKRGDARHDFGFDCRTLFINAKISIQCVHRQLP